MASPLGSAPGIMVGVGVGNAASAALEPLVEPGRQNAWSDHPNRVLDPGLVARLVAQGAVELDPGIAQAKREGFNDARFKQLVYLAQQVPGLGELDHLSNRKLITPEQLADALNRHAYPKDWHQPLVELMAEILTPGELAAAIHRGLVPDPINPATGEGLLKGEQPQPPFNVEAYPTYPIPTLAEAEGSGYDIDRLGVLVGLQGLPMGVIEAAHAYWRGIITHGDYIRAFNESNNRNEWADAVLQYSRQIPTARDFFENALRGHHTFEWAAEQAARHGMTATDSEIIYQNQGRPLNLHQISQALAWGATYNPGPGDNPDPWMQSVLLGPVRPEFYDMQHTLKYIVPSVFAIRSLAETGVWKEPKVAARLKQAGWIPEDADEVAKAWTTTTAAAEKINPYLAKAETQLWTALHKAYVTNGALQSDIDPRLQVLVPDDATRLAIFSLWDVERDALALAPPAA